MLKYDCREAAFAAVPEGAVTGLAKEIWGV
jgi:hypothetical protein